jgi:hypothetical protein
MGCVGGKEHAPPKSNQPDSKPEKLLDSKSAAAPIPQKKLTQDE